MSILIAYNNDESEDLHTFFETCADEIKQCCVDANLDFIDVMPPYLDELHVCAQMENHEICVIASHGNPDGIVNTLGEPIVSIRTTNYNFSNKVLYAVSCYCGQQLLPELKRLGLSTFVGYDDELRILEYDPIFVDTTLSGIKCILNGFSHEDAKKAMLDEYTKGITSSNDKQVKMLLLHNREHLCFE